MKTKQILISTFKSKMFYVSLGLLFILVIIDLMGIEVGVKIGNTNESLSLNAINESWFQFISMLKIVPPIFLLIGLLDIWVPRETMIRLMGENSGMKGVFIAFVLGTMSAGPLIAAFPVAQVMLKKGARYANVLFFITIWASAKLPILFFQATTLGLTFTLLSNITLIIVYFIGTLLIEKLLGHEEKRNIITLAENS